jgi:protein-disulfide isomerase
MKRQHAMLLGAAGLILAFVVAGILYQGRRAQELGSLARSGGPPFVRVHAQTLGPADAKVVVVEFFDPACETCRVFAPYVKSLVAHHAGKVRLVLRYAPLHAGSDSVVKMLEAARLQGKYWEALQVMFDTQPQWASHHRPQPEKLWDLLPAAGLDMEALRRDVNEPGVQAIVRQDIADATALGVRKTPEFFVNGRPLPSFGREQLRDLVESEIRANY